MYLLGQIVALLPWCSVCLSVCLDLHFSTDLCYGWIVQCSEHPDTKACPPTPSCPFSAPPGREIGYGFTGWNQGQGTVLWFQYAFLKQYCEFLCLCKSESFAWDFVSQLTATGTKWSWYYEQITSSRDISITDCKNRTIQKSFRTTLLTPLPIMLYNCWL